MVRPLVCRLFLVFVVVFVCFIGFTPNLAAQISRITTSAIPLIFEQNEEQVSAHHQFLAPRNGMESLYDPYGMDILVPRSRLTRTRLQIRWIGANRHATVAGENALPRHSSDLRGSEEAAWLRGIARFARVRYEQRYPGINLLPHGNGDEPENEYVLEAGADPSQIAFRFDRSVRLISSGDVDIIPGKSAIRLQKSIAHQEFGINGQQLPLEFLLLRNRVVSFRVGAYDRNRPLVIDPVFGFSTYLAGTGNDQITGATADAAGNLYVTDSTTPVDFPLAKSEQPTCARQAGVDAGHSPCPRRRF